LFSAKLKVQLFNIKLNTSKIFLNILIQVILG